MNTNIQEQINKLKAAGKKENVDFRVVYYGNYAEIKMIKK